MLPLLCQVGLRCLGIWRSVDWYLFTEVSGQPNGSVFKGQTVQEKIVLGLLDLCFETSVTTNKRCIKSQKSEDFVGGRLSPIVQIFIQQQAYFLQYD
jgi:hypothetical protein